MATGAIAISKALLRYSIASTTAFQTWDGNSWSLSQALSRIYIDAVPPKSNGDDLTDAEYQALMPFAIVFKPNGHGVTVQKDAHAYGWTASGMLVAKFVRIVPQQYRNVPDAAITDFEEFMGAVMRTGDVNSPGLAELAHLEGHLLINRMEDDHLEEASELEKATQGQWQVYGMRVWWGVQGHGGARR